LGDRRHEDKDFQYQGSSRWLQPLFCALVGRAQPSLPDSKNADIAKSTLRSSAKTQIASREALSALPRAMLPGVTTSGTR
jgi:hypothetical protein